MKLFDLHADIGYDVLFRQEAGNQDILRLQHIPKLLEGEVMGVGMASFFEGHEDLERAKKMVSTLRDEILANPETLHLYTGGHPHPSKINAMLTVEGMCFIKENPEETLDWLYEQGVRIGSLCWNDENALATGIKGNPRRGLSELGVRAIKHMNKIGMIIDISHTNEKSFWDILSLSQKPVIATHSNSRLYSNVDRNLSDQMAKALIDQGGLIGLVAARKFVTLDETTQDAAHLSVHASHFKDLGGLSNIAVGFDYMDFLGEGYGRKSMARDLQDASQSQNLIKALELSGFTQEEIQAIAWENAVAFLESNL